VLKESAPDELVDCIKAVVMGTARRSPGSPSARPAGHATATEASLRSACALTGREHAVVSGVVRALSNKQIARDLALSEGTIKVHLHNIYQKLHIQNRTELAIWAAGHIGDAD
jgi:DNA-binding NarL/FixJ family response regulator